MEKMEVENHQNIEEMIIIKMISHQMRKNRIKLKFLEEL